MKTESLIFRKWKLDTLISLKLPQATNLGEAIKAWAVENVLQNLKLDLIIGLRFNRRRKFMGSLAAMYVLVIIICIAIVAGILVLEKVREKDEER